MDNVFGFTFTYVSHDFFFLYRQSFYRFNIVAHLTRTDCL